MKPESESWGAMIPPAFPRKGEQLFIIYDERAMSMNTDDAQVLCCADTLKEARRDCREMFPRGVIFRYDVQGQELVNEEFIEWAGAKA